MAKVKLLKYHNGNKSGTIIEVQPARVDYLVRCKIGVVVEQSAKDESQTIKTTTTVKKDKNKPCKTC